MLGVHIFFLTTLAHSLYSSSFDYYSALPVIKLASFGFLEGGYYDISVNLSVESQIAIALITESKVKEKYSIQEFSYLCSLNVTDDYFAVSSMNVSSFNQNGMIKDKGVYTPIVINCNRNISKYWIQFEFRNRDFFIDSRDYYIPEVHVLLSIVHSIFFLIWFTNGVLFPMFKVRLHTVLLSLPIPKVISLLLFAKFWKLKRDSNITDMSIMVKVHIMNTIHSSVLFAVISMISSGWNIFRNSLIWKECSRIWCSSIIMTIGLVFIQGSQSIIRVFILSGMIVFGFLWYIKNNMISVLSITRLLKRVDKTTVVAIKISLSKEFTAYTTLTVGITILLYCLSSSLDCSFMLTALIIEAGFVIETIVAMKYFLLRSNYFGKEPETRLEDRSFHMKPANIIEPIGTQISLVSYETV